METTKPVGEYSASAYRAARIEYWNEYAKASPRYERFRGYYRRRLAEIVGFLIPSGKRVLELGCGRGDLLASLRPSYGVGIDFGAATIAKANARHPDLHFCLGDVEDPATLVGIDGPFDYVVIADTIGMFEDIDATLRLVNHLCAPSTRIIIS